MTLADRPMHDRTIELAAGAIDGYLSATEAAELQTHLAGCAACARIAAAMRTDAAALARPLDLLPSRQVDEAVTAAIAREGTARLRYGLLVPTALVLVAILVAMLGIIVAGGYLRRATEDGLRTTVVPSIPPVVRVSPAPDPATPVAIGDTWETADIDDGSTGRSIEAVAIAGSTLVGVGRGECLPDFTDATACYGAAWTSSAAQGWTASPNQPGLEVGHGPVANGFPLRGISDVVDGPAGLVAVGYDVDPPPSACAVAPCPTGPAVWRSADGQTWERAHIDLGPGVIDRFSQPIAAITADQRGYVMVGYAQTLGGDGSIGARAEAWFSPNGIDWTRASDAEDLDVGTCQDTGEEPSCGGMLDVATTDTGFVAVGNALNGNDGQSRPAAWTSPDGLTWTLASNGLDFDGRLSAVAAGDGGIVGVGLMCTPDCVESNSSGVAVASSDGSAWTATPLSGAPELSAIASTGPEFFAIGALANDGPIPGAGGMELRMYRSPDGSAWRQEATLPTIADVGNYAGLDIAATGDRLVVVTSANGSDFDRSVSYSSPAAAGPTEPAANPSAAPQ